MPMEIIINGVSWFIRFVPADSPLLTMYNGEQTVGMTDLNRQEVYLSDELHGDFLLEVFMHEMCHCFVASYGYDIGLDDEECMCQIMQKYGKEIYSLF